MSGWWESFFYTPVDPTALALFRMLFGLIIVVDAVSYLRSARVLLDPDGMLPFATWRAGPDQKFFSLFRWLPVSNNTVTLVIVIYGVAGLCICIGLTTRFAAAVAFVTGVSIYHRNRYILHSGDAVLRILSFLMIFSDAGRVWSADAVMSPESTVGSAPWALRLMQLQVALLYLHAVRHKLKGKMWRSGTATHYATRLLTHRRRRLPPFIDGMVAHRLATYGTLAAELAAGTLVWFDATRYFALGAIAGLHLTLQILMRMHLFQWIMLVSLILFVPGEDVAWLARWLTL